MEELEIELRGEKLFLDPNKVIYWKRKSVLILADLHLGKAAHFRKHGIAVPVQVHQIDLVRLSDLVLKYQPDKICFLGDLFHSDLNAEWEVFSNWMKNYPKIEMTLIKGNHDILGQNTYLNANLSMEESWHDPPFFFTHEKQESDHYNISGHVHPAVRLRGRAKQGLTVPCFYFTETFGMIPSFGEFTGTYKIKPRKGDRVYGVTKEEVIALMT